MKLSDIKALLETVGFPVAYNEFGNPQTPPYICYIETGTDNMPADGTVYNKIRQITIELYTDIKSPDTEETLEDVLDGAGIFYEKSEVYIDSEKIYETIYEIEV